MWQYIVRGLLICIVGLLSACDHLTQITLSENMINNYLAKQPAIHKNVGINGLAQADFTLTNLKVAIARSEPDIVLLTGKTKVILSSLIGDQAANIDITLQATPYYNHTQGSIYLKNLKVVSFEAEPKKLQNMLTTLEPYLNEIIQQYCDHNPIYTLSDDKGIYVRIAKKVAKGLEIKPGELIIPFA